MKKVLAMVCTLALCTGVAAAQSTVKRAADNLVQQSIPRGPLPRTVIPRHYLIDLVVLPEHERFSGRVSIRVSVTEATARIWMHGKGLSVSDAHAFDRDGHEIAARYAQVDPQGVAELTLAEPLAVGDATLVLSYAAPFQTRSLDGLAKITDAGRAYIVSDGFPIDSRLIFPGFDEPAFKASFELSVTTQRHYEVIANTPEARSEALAGGLERTTFAASPPLPTYVFFFAVGDFDVVPWRAIAANAVRDHAVPLRGVAGSGKGAKLEYALANTEGILNELETYLGIPYPYAKLDMIAPPGYGGGMENAAAIIYGERYLLFDERSSLLDQRGYAFVHAHELSHQWFGNLVTPAWWDDLWLNEGFASWLANRSIARWAPQRGFERDTLKMGLAAMDRDSRRAAQPFRRPVRTADDLAGRMNPLVFDKGAALLAMFEGYVGEDVFRRAVRRYLGNFSLRNVRAENFLNVFGEIAEPRTATALQTFIEQPGVPLLAVDWNCANDKLVVDVTQSRYLPLGSRLDSARQWHVPMCLSYDVNGLRERRCELLEDGHETMSFDVAQCPVAVMPDANGFGYYRFSMPPARFRSLVAHIDQMEPTEALALEDSLAAAMNAGTLDVAAYLEAVPRIAAHPSGDVAVAPLPRLAFVLRHLLTSNERDKAREFARRLYEPRLDRIGLSARSQQDRSNPDEAALLRDALVPFLALEARAPKVREELIEIARAYVGWRGDGKVHSGVAERAVMRTALAVAAQELRRPFLDHLWQQFKASNDATFRSDVLRAFASVTEPAEAQWVRGLILHPELNAGEAQELFTKQAELAENFAASWAWQKKNFSSLTSRAVSAYEHETLLSVAAGFCSRGGRDQAEASLRPIAAGLDDGPRMLDDVVEQIELCAALKERQEDSARSYSF
jgi:cytosol alanyl aminopeptidase